MSDVWQVEVVPLPAHDGWLLRCTERPEVVVQLSTLDDMGETIAQAIAESIGRSDSCDQVPGLYLSGASRTQDLVQAIAVADGVPADLVGIVFDPI